MMGSEEQDRKTLKQVMLKRSSSVRPLSKQEWSKLLDEATEEDKRTDVGMRFDLEEEEEENPLNLCAKAVTMPNFTALDLSACKKMPPPVSIKSILSSHTMPNICRDQAPKKEITKSPEKEKSQLQFTNSLNKNNVRKIWNDKENNPLVKKSLVFTEVKSSELYADSGQTKEVIKKTLAVISEVTSAEEKPNHMNMKNMLSNLEVDSYIEKKLKDVDALSKKDKIEPNIIINNHEEMVNDQQITCTSQNRHNHIMNNTPFKKEDTHLETQNSVNDVPVESKSSFNQPHIEQLKQSVENVQTNEDNRRSLAKPSIGGENHTADVRGEDNISQSHQELLHQQLHQTNNRFAIPEVPIKRETAKDLITVNGKFYRVLAIIGRGGSSTVYLVLSKDNMLLAVKRVKLSNVDEKTRNDYLNEIEHLLKMQHSPHVIKLFDHQYVPSKKCLFAVMERGDTDLSRYLKDRANSGERISPELILFYWSEMLMAVKNIHDNNIIHRDLKPANFLLVAGRLKLIDFGIASSIQNEQTSVLKDCLSGTCNYMSPEAIQDLGSGDETVVKIGRKSDVWSLGCILYYFLYSKTPFQDFKKFEIKLRTIANPNYKVQFPKIPGVPEVLFESCRRCLIHDKNKRASIDELIELKNQPLLSPTQVISKLQNILSPEQIERAKILLEDDGDVAT